MANLKACDSLLDNDIGNYGFFGTESPPKHWQSSPSTVRSWGKKYLYLGAIHVDDCWFHAVFSTEGKPEVKYFMYGVKICDP